MAVVACAGFLTPTYAFGAIGTSFGGQVLTILPCISTLGPSLFVTIKPSGLFHPFYIWTPATINKLAGPPTHPGQQILGVADVPFACFTPGFFFIPPTFYFGQRMQYVGTSPL